MKMPESFSQMNSATLVLAAGVLDAKVYILQNGRVVQSEEVRKEPVAASRHEDVRKEAMYASFLRTLTERMDEMEKEHTVEKVILFAPEEYMEDIKMAVPEGLRQKILYQAPGSFYKRPITDLLRTTLEHAEERPEKSEKPSASGGNQNMLRSQTA